MLLLLSFMWLAVWPQLWVHKLAAASKEILKNVRLVGIVNDYVWVSLFLSQGKAIRGTCCLSV